LIVFGFGGIDQSKSELFYINTALLLLLSFKCKAIKFSRMSRLKPLTLANCCYHHGVSLALVGLLFHG